VCGEIAGCVGGRVVNVEEVFLPPNLFLDGERVSDRQGRGISPFSACALVG